MKNYKKLAIQTECVYDYRVRDRLGNVSSARLLHGVMGIVSEINELTLAIDNSDRINVGEEISDVTWYVGGILSDELNINIDEYTPPNTTSTSIQYELNIIINTSSEMMDILKKWFFYGREIVRDDLVAAVYNIYSACYYLCQFFDLDIEDIKRKNIEKLHARYGEKFSENRAKNRDLNREREILSGV